MITRSSSCRSLAVAGLLTLFLGSSGIARQASAAPPAAKALPPCRRAIIEGELKAGQELSKPFAGGLRVWVQPIASGWILRVVPRTGPIPNQDYAELATPPYRSVTPLSLSTDFAFRAQDAVGWNPRRFRYATSAAGFAELKRSYDALLAGGTASQPGPEARLAHLIATSTEPAELTILDARLVPGTADQWIAAGAVASHFNSTAHTLVQEPGFDGSPLGKLVWIKFRLALELAPGTQPDPAVKVESQTCPEK